MRGEDEACRFLEERGHTILERNWRGGHVEIDIVTLASGGLHFVEVKSRTAPATADPEDNVDWRKRKHIVQAAQKFLHSDKMPRVADFELFFDVLTVLFDKDNIKIDYYPQAFIPTYV